MATTQAQGLALATATAQGVTENNGLRPPPDRVAKVAPEWPRNRNKGYCGC